MKHIVAWLSAAMVVILLMIAGIIFSMFTPSNLQQQNYNSMDLPGQRVIVTEENFPVYLSSTSLVNDLPSGASILLRTENKTYAVEKGTVTEGSLASPDMIITLPASYIPKLSNGFCSTMQQAYSNGDLSFSLNIGSISAAWKYRNMMKYKSCLGI